MSEHSLPAQFIKKIDDVCLLNKKLEDLGFTSVFDIIRIPKNVFIKQYASSLNGRAEAVYHLALGFAAQLKRLFRQNPATVNVGAALRGSNVNALLKNGPTYQGLFDDNWAAYCLSGTSEANDSPVSYLAYIYNQALSFEAAATQASETIIPLSQRRPDLATLNIDNDSVNLVVPALSLVNEILSSSVGTYLGTDVNVDQTLAVTHYPNNLPYHFAHQQTKLSLANSKSSLLEVMGQSDLSWPYFIQPALNAGNAPEAFQLACNLAPEQQVLLTDVPYFSTHMLLLADITAANGWGSSDYNTRIIPLWLENIEEAYLIPFQDNIPSNLQSISTTPKQYDVTSPFPMTFAVNNTNENINFNIYGVTGTTRPVNNERYDDGFIVHYLGLSSGDNSSLSADILSSKSVQSFYLQIQPYPVGGKTGQLSLSIALSGDDVVFPYSDTQNAFYKNNFGKNIAGYPDISTVQTLSSATGSASTDIEDLLCHTLGGSNVLLSPNTTIINTVSVPDPKSSFRYGACYIHAGLTPEMTLSKDESDVVLINNLSDDRADRINRMIRLQRWLALPYDQVDLLITSAMHAEGDNNLGLYTNNNTLRTLGVYHEFNQKYGVSAEQFAAFIYQITPYAISPNTPFLDRVFNNPSLFEDPFVVDWQDFNYTLATGRDARIVKQISAGLGISEAQFVVLANVIAGVQGNKGAHTLNCSLDVIAAFYRLVMLPKVIGLSLVEGLALMELLNDGALLTQLASVPVIQPLVTTTNDNGVTTETIADGDALNNLLAFEQTAQWLLQHSLSAAECDLLLRSPVTPPVITTAQQSFIADTNQQLEPTLLTQDQLTSVGAPTTDSSGTSIVWLTLLSDLVDDSGLIKNVAVNDDGTTLTTIVADVTADTTALALSSDVINAIANLIEQTRITQQSVATTALAKALQVTQTLPDYLLQWDNSTVYDFLSQNWALNDAGSELGDTTSSYLTLLVQLVRYAAIAQRFTLSPAFLSDFLVDPAWFGLPDTTPSLPAFYLFSRYSDLLLLTPGTEDDVLAYFTLVNNGTFADVAAAADLLASLLDWDASEVTLAAAQANETGIAQTLPQIDLLMRLRSLWQQTNASVTPLLATAALTTQSDYAAWQQVGESWVATQN